MAASTVGSAQQLLDEVYSLARLEAFAPEGYLRRLADELGAAATYGELEAVDAHLRASLAGVDEVASRVMRILLDRALADDRSIAVATRKVFAATVLAYGDALTLLGDRARDAARRVDPAGAAATAARVVEAATASLALHAQLRAGVLALVRERAAAALPVASHAAQDRRSDDATRMRWSAVRRELEVLREHPERIAAARFSERVAAQPPLLEEPAPEPERTRGELLELD